MKLTVTTLFKIAIPISSPLTPLYSFCSSHISFSKIFNLFIMFIAYCLSLLQEYKSSWFFCLLLSDSSHSQNSAWTIIDTRKYLLCCVVTNQARVQEMASMLVVYRLVLRICKDVKINTSSTTEQQR